MMKTLAFKVILLAFSMVSLAVNANAGHVKMNGKYAKERTIKKEFNVNADALFMARNSYGNLNITSWNENRVVIEVHIKANGNDEERVQERLDEINVAFEIVPVWFPPQPNSAIATTIGIGAGVSVKT